ncbi:MAG: activity regulator of membrane protease YbbK [endosymbiont of Galathealinum brachiosum]|uniref:Activity regulator of membrane protease YbbK n=1 Tax=endosymbiont of Galathealinum brachiosum TaxID=2200906 RepID=A0A370DKZ1_9GAMM|nr:MAG: activity regulator of membrane protease YbbK [endosymbiont of Galathealinum brachiosum]
MIAEYIYTHQAEFWIMLGFLMLVIEVSTGLVTGILLFGGIGAIITGLLMLAGLLNETWQIGIASSAICAAIITFLLWKPLKKMQNADVPEKDNSSDLVGYEFVLQQDINLLTPGSVQYSGINWKVEIHKDAGVEEISAATRVTVCSVDVGKFRVKPV